MMLIKRLSGSLVNCGLRVTWSGLVTRRKLSESSILRSRTSATANALTMHILSINSMHMKLFALFADVCSYLSKYRSKYHSQALALVKTDALNKLAQYYRADP